MLANVSRARSLLASCKVSEDDAGVCPEYLGIESPEDTCVSSGTSSFSRGKFTRRCLSFFLQPCN
jgi:hypothetical protein